MTQTTSLAYENALKAVDGLNDAERQALMAHLQQQSEKRRLTSEEWWQLFNATLIRVPVIGDFSNRREDWYGDDGR